MTRDVEEDDIYPADFRAAQKAQASALKADAAELGLRVEAYMVPSVAQWVLAQVETGRFLDPSEVVFVAMQAFIELEEYPDLKRELFQREITKRLNDDRPGIPGEEVMARLKKRMNSRGDRKPPIWSKVPYPRST